MTETQLVEGSQEHTERADQPEPQQDAATPQPSQDAEGSDREATDGEATDGEAQSSADRPEQSRPGQHRSRGRSSKEELIREGEIAADYLETLLDIADLDGDLDVDIDGERASVAIVDSEDGRVPRRLVGTNGAVLEALQELSRLAVQAETGDRSWLMLDVAGHRAQRKAELLALAQEAVAEVKSSGECVELEPMSAFERKVVHDAVLAAGLVSESEGVEPRRHVVVSPA